MMRVLLVEDDAASANSIEKMLEPAGYVCEGMDLGESGFDLGKLFTYDLIILDITSPDSGGYEVLRRLRAAKIQTPILILSGLSEPDHEIMGLYYGADDYLTKPFSGEELIARIRAIVKRPQVNPETVIRIGEIDVNLNSCTVQVNGRHVHLTGREFEILALLSLRKGTIVSKEILANHLYGGVKKPASNGVLAYVSKLRRKLTAATGDDNYIRTVPGQGYLLDDPKASGTDDQIDWDRAVA